MPAVGWIFLIIALALILGSLMILRDSAHGTQVSDKKMKRILARKTEMEAREKAEDND